MTAVTIGAVPHKGSHTAVVIGAAEEPLGELRICGCQGNADRRRGRTVAGAGRGQGGVVKR